MRNPAVTTAPNTPNTTTVSARIALAGAGLVAGGAIVGSASALLSIAQHAQMSAPWSLPVSLDLTGLVAALVIRHRRRDTLAWAALLATVVISTALQVFDAPPDLWSRVAHGVVPVGALLSFELAMRVARPEPTPAPVAPPAPALKRTTAPAKTRKPRVTLAELLPVAETVAAELTAAGRAVTATALRNGMKAAGHSIGSQRATQLLAHLTATTAPAAAAA